MSSLFSPFFLASPPYLIMSTSICNIILKGAASRTLFTVCSRSLTTTSSFFAGANWRYKQGKSTNNSSYGPLTDLPDYTYLDGRPTELSVSQTVRRKQRINTAARVMCLISEMKQSQENYQYRLELEEREREEIVRKKLKPKQKYIRGKK